MHDTNTNDRFGDLLAAVARETENWIPETAGEQVAGEVLELDQIETAFGIAPAVTLLTGDGREVRVAGFGTVLNRAIGAAQIEPGDLLAVRFLGQKTAAGGAAYKDYKVVVRNADGSGKNRGRPATGRPADPELVDLDQAAQGIVTDDDHEEF